MSAAVGEPHVAIDQLAVLDVDELTATELNTRTIRFSGNGIAAPPWPRSRVP